MDEENIIDELKLYATSLTEGHSDLAPRLRKVTHEVVSKHSNIKVHAHFLSFRDGKATVGEFIDLISRKMMKFCLHRKHVSDFQLMLTKLSQDQQMERYAQLYQEAVDLFKKANKKTNRNGEFGELITYLLIEMELKAPQFLAKMSLKTNSQMPVHGSDGIHIGLEEEVDGLKLYWGESKCYTKVNSALDKAVESVKESLEHGKMNQELFLIRQNFELSDFPDKFKEPILSFLDPYSENYNLRRETSVIFIAFDFDKFAAVKGIKNSDIEQAFIAEIIKALPDYVQVLDEKLEEHQIDDHSVEIFFLPVPSVPEMRELFQNRIGWTN